MFSAICHFGWVGKHANIIMKPTNSPTTQGQPTPRENSSTWAILSGSYFFFRGLGLIFVETQNTINPNPTKSSANSLLRGNIVIRT